MPGNHGDQIAKCKQRIKKVQQLDFAFDYQGNLRERAFKEGDVVELPDLTSLEIKLGPPEVSEHDRKSCFVRVGQDAPYTKLFEIELIIHTQAEFLMGIYECNIVRKKRTKVREFAGDDFWIYREHILEKTVPGDRRFMRNQSGNHFSVYLVPWIVGFAKVTIGNVGSNLGVFVQRGGRT